jgi:hypothetical protein
MLCVYSLLASLLLLPLTHTYTCTPTPHLLPRPTDCHSLIDALTLLSSSPPYNTPKLWSRLVEDTDSTLKLPKDYWLQGRGPETCAVHIDVVGSDHHNQARNEEGGGGGGGGGRGDWRAENDTFTLGSVANVMEIVVEQCLVRRRELGWGCPGVKGAVGARVVRTDAPWLRRGVRRVRRVGEVEKGVVVWEATDLEGGLVGGLRNGTGVLGLGRNGTGGVGVER